MIKMFHGLFGIILCTTICCDAASLVDNQINVGPQGETDLAAMLGRSKISVKITTHEIDIGKASDVLPEKRLTNCTYSRFPCSLVDYVDVSVDSNTLFVARSLYADLADVSKASLRLKKNGQFLLTLSGGDASESYTVEVTFDKQLVRQRELRDNMDGQVLQRTIYYASQSMDK